jgi:hypothetical protein
VPKGEKPLYRDTSSFAGAPKKNGEDVRPLGTVYLMSKIAGKVHNKLLKNPFNEDHSPPLINMPWTRQAMKRSSTLLMQAFNENLENVSSQWMETTHSTF